MVGAGADSAAGGQVLSGFGFLVNECCENFWGDHANSNTGHVDRAITSLEVDLFRGQPRAL